MWISFGLSVALLVNIPFLGNVDVRHLWRSRHSHAAASDTLPPPWRTASRLALENEFVRAELPDLTPEGSSLRLTLDPRVLHVAVDPDSGTLSAAPELGDVELGAGATWSLGSYGSVMMGRTFRRDWNARSLANLNSLGANAVQSPANTPGIHIPVGHLPSALTPFLGPGGPAINVRGSE